MSNFRHITKEKGPVPIVSTNGRTHQFQTVHSINKQNSRMGLVPLQGIHEQAKCPALTIRGKVLNPVMGFTLVETLVAITLLLLVIVGPMTIASKGMRNAYFAGDQTTATFLAQEAIEHIQSLRDNNALENVDEYQTLGNNDDDNVWEWHTPGPAGVNWGSCRSSSGCDVNFGGDYKICGSEPCRLSRYTGSASVDRIYDYTPTGVDWISSPYTRVIQVGDVIGTDLNGDPIAVPVTVTVSWQSSLFGTPRTVVLQTYLYNLLTF